MAATIILSPEISTKARELMLLDGVLFKSDANNIKAEELLKEILAMLPRGIIGFTHNGRVFLKEQIVQSLLELEEFELLPEEEEEEQPKEAKEE